MMYQYPLELSFKIIALAPQIFVRDASGNEVLYIKQKMLKLKEDISIFRDSSQTSQLYRIQADRIIDFSARYSFTDSMTGEKLGSIKRQGMRSIFKAEYNVFAGEDQHVMNINEDNPWIRVGDLLLGEIPILSMFTGYFFNPTYTISTANGGQAIMKLKKQPAIFEGKFTIECLVPNMGEREEKIILLSWMMMTLLERMRG